MTEPLGGVFPLAGVPVRSHEDPALARHLGLVAVRVPLSWASLVPRAGAVSDSEVEGARETVGAFRSEGLAVWVGLLDGPPPGWFLDEGGFGDPKAAGRWWPRFVDLAAETVGDLVDGWVPMVDPVGYGRRAETDPERHAQMQRQLVVSWRDAWRVLRGGPPVATCLGLAVVRPSDDTVPALQTARELDALVWRTWLRGLRDGTVAVPGLAEVEVPELVGAADVVGARFRATDRIEPDRWHDDLAGAVRRLAEEAPSDRPLHVTLHLPADDEARRGQFVDASLAAVADARGDGVPITQVWAEPLVGDAASGALVDADRVPRSSCERWLA